MSKKEFLDILYGQLIDQMPEPKVQAHIRYYQNYIDEEIRKGRSAEEVLSSLGDPRLIAKTLADTDPEPAGWTDANQSTYTSGSSDYSREDDVHVKHRRIDLSTWYGKLLVILVAGAVLFLLFMVLSFLIPFLLLAGVALFLFSQFRKRR